MLHLYENICEKAMLNATYALPPTSDPFSDLDPTIILVSFLALLGIMGVFIASTSMVKTKKKAAKDIRDVTQTYSKKVNKLN